VVQKGGVRAGLPIPLKMILPPGIDLTDFIKDGATKNEKVAD
jgi:hypothetical protein